MVLDPGLFAIYAKTSVYQTCHVNDQHGACVLCSTYQKPVHINTPSKYLAEACALCCAFLPKPVCTNTPLMIDTRMCAGVHVPKSTRH